MSRPMFDEMHAPNGVVREHYRHYARWLAEQPPEAMAAAKLAIEFATDLDRAQARNMERLINSSRCKTSLGQRSRYCQHVLFAGRNTMRQNDDRPAFCRRRRIRRSHNNFGRLI